MARFQNSTTRRTKPPPDPFRLGWRYVTRRDAKGKEILEQIPLTEWDVLHPQEGDFIVQNEAHTRDCVFLKISLEHALKQRPHIKVTLDHRIDWQQPGVLPHGPDIVVLGNVQKDWDPERGTFPVRDMDAEVLLVIEVTSPTTRKFDVGKKIREYHKAKIPFYMIVDNRKRKGRPPSEIIGYQAGAERFELMPPDSEDGLFIPTVNLYFKIDDGRVRVFDKHKRRIPEPLEMDDMVKEAVQREEAALLKVREERERAEQEKQRAEQEKQRAEQEKQRADLEKQRADLAEERIRELEARLKLRQGNK
jgi:Uma2 family endonuclease